MRTSVPHYHCTGHPCLWVPHTMLFPRFVRMGQPPVYTLMHFVCSAPSVGRTPPCVSAVVPYYFRTFSEKDRSVCGHHSSLLTPHSLQEGEPCVHMQPIGCTQRCPSVPAGSVSILQNPLFRSYGTLLVLREVAGDMLQ